MKNWDVEKLGDVCSFFNGQAHEKCIDENGKFKLINSKFVSTESENFKRTNNALSPLFVNDIVMVMSDVPNGKTLAKCFIVDKDDSYTLNQRICVIRSKKFNTRFLYYQLNRNKYLLSFDNGENQSNLRKDDILNCKLFVPPLPEQQRIVSILDEAFAAIAKAKANAEQNFKNAKELFENYLQSVFENKGEDWEEKTLGELATFRNGMNFSKNGKGEKIYIVGVKNFKNSFWVPFEILETVILDGKLNELDQLNEGDIIAVRSNGNPQLIGRTLLASEVNGKVSHSGFTIRIRLNSKNIDPIYLCNFLKISSTRKILVDGGNGVGIKSLNQGSLSALLIPFPKSTKAQLIIVQKLDALSSEMKKLEAIYQQKINDLEELKKSVLQKAFNGELKTKKAVAL